MKIDYISDLHLDSWVSRGKNLRSILKTILPKEPARVLLIGGDLGHSNKQNISFLRSLAHHYEYVGVVPGNHDYYIFGKDNEKFGKDSQARINDLKERISKIPQICFLDGTSFSIDDITIGGCGMWYDGQFAVENFGVSQELLRPLWMSTMNDSRLIFGMPEMNEMFKNEYEKLDKIIDSCDVFVSHIGPDWSKIHPRFMGPSTGFFYFDGREILKRCDGKHWVFGHTHDKMMFTSEGCHMYCNPFGYPGETQNRMIESLETELEHESE